MFEEKKMGVFDKKRYVETLSQMVKIPTISISDDERTKCVDEFHAYVKNRFPNIVKTCEFVDEFDGGLMIVWRGEDKQKSPIALMSHLDVANVEGQDWSREPFSGDVENGKIFGRGTADTKSSLCAFLEAVEKLIDDGFKPKSDVYLLSSSREEVGGKDAVLMAKYFADHNIKPALLVDEGGAVLDQPMSFIDGRFAMIAMSERSASKLFLKGDAKKLEKFKKKVQKQKFVQNAFPAEVEEMFKRMTPKMKSPMQGIFKHFDSIKNLLVKLLPKFSKEGGAMVAPSYRFSVDENGNEVMNVLCTYYHGIEILTRKIVEYAKKCGIEAKIDNVRIAPKPTDFNADGVKLIEKTVVEVFEETEPTPFIIFGGTDARQFGNVVDTVIRFAPLIMTNEIISTVHNPNEFIFEESVCKAVEFYCKLLVNFQKY